MIKMLEGYHLTARDREAISHAIRQGWSQCNTPRKWYEITPDGPGLYRVRSGNKSEKRVSKFLIEWKPARPSELTDVGEQYIIPGTEKRQGDHLPAQRQLFGDDA